MLLHLSTISVLTTDKGVNYIVCLSSKCVPPSKSVFLSNKGILKIFPRIQLTQNEKYDACNDWSKYCQRLQAVIYVNIVRFQGEQNPIRINKTEKKRETLQKLIQNWSVFPCWWGLALLKAVIRFLVMILWYCILPKPRNTRFQKEKKKSTKTHAFYY